MWMGEGGTIPFMAMLGQKFPQAQFLITGVLGPHSNAHGPNEFLHIAYAKKLTAVRRRHPRRPRPGSGPGPDLADVQVRQAREGAALARIKTGL